MDPPLVAGVIKISLSKINEEHRKGFKKQIFPQKNSTTLLPLFCVYVSTSLSVLLYPGFARQTTHPSGLTMEKLMEICYGSLHDNLKF
jgi:hypothetical protein